MGKAAAIIITIALLAVFLIYAPSITQRIDTGTRQAQQEWMLEQQQKQWELQREQEIGNNTTGVAISREVFNQLIVPLLILVALGLVVHMYYMRREPLIRPDERGLMPVSRKFALSDEDIQRLAYQMAREFIKTGQIAAMHQPGQTPHTFAPHTTHNPTYAPRLATTNVDLDGEEDPDASPKRDDIPPFSKLLQQGQFGPGQGLMLGISDNDEGQPENYIRGTSDDIASAVIGGVRGSGKTTTALFIAGQWCMFDGKLIIADPHGNATGQGMYQTLKWNLEPLEHSYLAEVAVSNEQILASAKLTRDILKRRIDGGSYDDRVMLIIDEFSSVMREGGETAEIISQILEAIATNGRKFDVTALLLGQQWHVKRSGGGELKDVLATAWIHRMLRKTANQIINLGPEMPQTNVLQPGEAWFYRGATELEHIYIPYTTREDLMLVRPSASTRGQMSDKAATIEKDPYLAPDVTSQRIMELYLNNVDPTAIVEDVFHIKGGRAFKPALDEVHKTIRAELARARGGSR